MEHSNLYRDIQQKVAGFYEYSGDFVITSRILYYFPLRALRTRPPDSVLVATAVGGPALGAAVASGTSQQSESTSLYRRPFLDIPKAIDASPTEPELQRWLDHYLSAFSEYRSQATDDLPLPTRVDAAQVHGTSFSFFGVLQVATRYDELYFKFGRRRMTRVREQLASAGFA